MKNLLKTDLKKFCKKALEIGALRTKIILTDTIIVANWVRIKCQYGCEGYGKRLSCPPYSPQPVETERILKEYTTGILFEGQFLKVIPQAAELEREIFLSGYYKAFGMGGGPCILCETFKKIKPGDDMPESCNLKNGCRHPRKSRPSMEACGIDVYQTLRNNGWNIEVVKEKTDKCINIGLVLVE